MTKFLFAVMLSSLLFCSSGHDVIHLTYCGDGIDSIASVTNGTSDTTQRAVRFDSLQRGQFRLLDLCFKDTLGDTISIKWPLQYSCDVLLELLNQDGYVIRTILKQSLSKGNYTILIQNSKDYRVYGVRLVYGTYDNTVWFYAS
jgi:hypothetical protein